MQPQNSTIHTDPKPQNGADDISLKDVINEVRIWFDLIKKQWGSIILIGLIGAAIGFIKVHRDIPVYTAITRFMLKNEGVGSLFGGQMTGLTSLLGGGQMGTPLERTAEVIASDRIVGRALLRPITVRDTTDLVINHFIRLSDLRKNWDNDSSLRRVTFNLNDRNILQLSLTQRKAYKHIKSMMVPEKGSGVVNKSFDKKSGVLTLSCVHRDESFAIALSEAIYNELTQFFIEQMTFSATNNAEVMKLKLDSIQREVDAVRSSYASKSDQSLGLLLQKDKVDLKALAVKEQMLNVMYAEALRNFEGYRFVNQAAMPSLTLIETPYPPLKLKKKSMLQYLLGMGAFFTFIFVISLRLYRYFKYKIDKSL